MVTADESRPSSVKYVSFAKCCLLFLGHPLAAGQQHEEIQLVFHPFNVRAGAAAQFTLAQAPIPTDVLEAEINDRIMKPSGDTSSYGLIQAIIKKVLGNESYILYAGEDPIKPPAPTDIQLPDVGGNTAGGTERVETRAPQDTPATPRHSPTNHDDFGNLGDELKMAKVVVRMDTTTKKKDSRTIVVTRIHFHDERAGANQLEKVMLMQTAGGKISGLDKAIAVSYTHLTLPTKA